VRRKAGGEGEEGGEKGGRRIQRGKYKTGEGGSGRKGRIRREGNGLPE